jgi:hypothetical protein
MAVLCPLHIHRHERKNLPFIQKDLKSHLIQICFLFFLTCQLSNVNKKCTCTRKKSKLCAPHIHTQNAESHDDCMGMFASVKNGC